MNAPPTTAALTVVANGVRHIISVEHHRSNTNKE
jgi:hypothetical protein